MASARLVSASKGLGKSGGARIIYFYDENLDRIWLLFVYPKSKQASMTEDERERVKALVGRLRA